MCRFFVFAVIALCLMVQPVPAPPTAPPVPTPSPGGPTTPPLPTPNPAAPAGAAPYKGYITVPAQSPSPTWGYNAAGVIVVTAFQDSASGDYVIPALEVVFTLSDGSPLTGSEPTYTTIEWEYTFSTAGWSSGKTDCTATGCALATMDAPSSGKFTAHGDYTGNVVLHETDTSHQVSIILRCRAAQTASISRTTPTPEETPSVLPTPSETPTSTASSTIPPTPTTTRSNTWSGTKTKTMPMTPSGSESRTSSFTSSPTVTPPPTPTPTVTVTVSPHPTPSATPSFTESPSISPSLTVPSSNSATKSITNTVPPTATASPTLLPTRSNTWSPSASTTVTPAPTPTPTASSLPTATLLPTPSPVPTPSAVPTPTSTFSDTITPAPTPTTTESASDSPSRTQSQPPTPSLTPSLMPNYVAANYKFNLTVPTAQTPTPFVYFASGALVVIQAQLVANRSAWMAPELDLHFTDASGGALTGFEGATLPISARVYVTIPSSGGVWSSASFSCTASGCVLPHFDVPKDAISIAGRYDASIEIDTIPIHRVQVSLECFISGSSPDPYAVGVIDAVAFKNIVLSGTSTFTGFPCFISTNTGSRVDPRKDYGLNGAEVLLGYTNTTHTDVPIGSGTIDQQNFVHLKFDSELPEFALFAAQIAALAPGEVFSATIMATITTAGSWAGVSSVPSVPLSSDVAFPAPVLVTRAPISAVSNTTGSSQYHNFRVRAESHRSEFGVCSSASRTITNDFDFTFTSRVTNETLHFQKSVWLVITSSAHHDHHEPQNVSSGGTLHIHIQNAAIGNLHVTLVLEGLYDLDGIFHHTTGHNVTSTLHVVSDPNCCVAEQISATLPFPIIPLGEAFPVVASVHGCPTEVHPSVVACPSNAAFDLTIIGQSFDLLRAVTLIDAAQNFVTNCTSLIIAANESSAVCTLPADLVGSGLSLGLHLTNGSTIFTTKPTLSFASQGIACPFSNETGTECGLGRCTRVLGICNCSDNANVNGLSCDVCAPSFFGPQCASECPRDPETSTKVCSDQGTCDGIFGNGTCLCNPGFAGLSCDLQCPGSAQNLCSGHGQCNTFTSGNCSCDASVPLGFWDGATCSTCALGYSGANCTTACPRSPTTNAVCSDSGFCTDGICVCNLGSCGSACEKNGDACSACPAGYYGSSCAKKCPAHPNTCNNHGACDGGQLGTGRCVCEYPYGGLACGSFCPGGVANPCSGHGLCLTDTATCVCNASYAGSACSVQCPGLAESNICSGHGTCNDGVTGAGTCTCEAGFFGDNCSQACSPCGGHGACDSTGTCICNQNAVLGHWSGAECGACSDEWSGPMCTLQCPFGGNGQQCSGHGTCNTFGACECNHNEIDGFWDGTTCSACNADAFGASCTSICPGASSSPGVCPSCGGHGICDSGLSGSGVCYCGAHYSVGWWDTFTNCTDCASGLFGTECTATCPFDSTSNTHCGQGTCNDGLGGDGVCTCFDGWTTSGENSTCSSCSAGRWGADCKGSCLSTNNGICDSHGTCSEGVSGTGVCTCSSGYVGANCSLFCPVWNDGNVCGEHGECLADGSCRCAQGFKINSTTNSTCTSCEANRFGPSCDLCTCENGATCASGSSGDGSCTCAGGAFWGKRCQHQCELPPNADSSICSGNGACSQLDGTCACFSNNNSGFWTGEWCDECQAAYAGSTACDKACPTSSAGGSLCSGRGTCVEGICHDCSLLPSDNFRLICGDSCATFDEACNTLCPSGMWGPPECASVCPTCNNGGLCDETTGTCACSREFSGAACDFQCASDDSGNTCSGRGVCRGSTCDCTTQGYFGTICQFICPGGIDNVCSGHGTCSGMSGECTCDAGFVGSDCKLDCPGVTRTSPPQPCNNAGTCSSEYVAGELAAICTCNSSIQEGFFTGADCASCKDSYSGATCLESCPNSRGVTVGRSCRCKPGFAGPACTLACPGQADGATCNNHGSCREGSSGDGTCVCEADWYGPNCAAHCTISKCKAEGGLTAPQCNTSTGACECQDSDFGRYAGERCDECKTFSWGATCALHCGSFCNWHGSCNRNSGDCNCFTDDVNGNWGGRYCDSCADGFIGLECRRRNIQMSANTRGTSTVRQRSKESASVVVDSSFGIAYVGSRPIVVFNTSSGVPATLTETPLTLGTAAHSFDLGGRVLSGTVSETDSTVQFLIAVNESIGSFELVSVSRGTSPVVVRRTAIASSNTTSQAAELNTRRQLAASSPSTSVLKIFPTVSNVSFFIIFADLSIFDGSTGSSYQLPPNITTITTAFVDTVSGLFVVAGENEVHGWTVITIKVAEMATDSWMVINQHVAPLAECTPDAATTTLHSHEKCMRISHCVAADDHQNSTTKHSLHCGLITANGPVIATLSGLHTPTINHVSNFIVLISGAVDLRFTAMATDVATNLLYVAFDHSSLPSSIYKLQMPSLAPTGALTLGGTVADPELALDLKILPATRELLIAIILDFRTELRSLNMFGVERVVPDIIDSRGELTVVTVVGEGFSKFAAPSCVFTTDQPPSPAVFVDEKTLKCVAPKSKASSGCSGSKFNIQFGARATTATNVEVLRPLPATLLSAGTQFGVDQPFGASQLDIAVTIRGLGFISSSFAKCRLVDNRGRIVTTWHSTFINSTSVACQQPRRPGSTSPSPSFLQYSHDGTLFSNSDVAYAIVGTGANIRVVDPSNFNARLMMVSFRSAAVAKVPQLEVHVVDIEGNSLHWLDSAPLGSGPHKIRVSALVEGSFSFADNSAAELTQTTTAGIATFAKLALKKPLVGSYHLLFETVQTNLNDWSTIIELAVTEGSPTAVALVRANETSQWVFGSHSPTILSPAVVAKVVDAAGNHVRNPASVPPLMFCEFSRAFSNGSATFTNAVVVVVASFEDGYYSFPDIVTQGTFGSTNRLSLTVRTAGIGEFRFDVSVANCDSQYYGIIGTFECRLCPSHGECDGSTIVKPSDGYWRPSQQQFTFHSCQPPHAPDTCRNGQCVGPYTGPRCSVCEEGYGRSGINCEPCGTRTRNIVLICLLALSIFMGFLIMVSMSVKQPLLTTDTGKKDVTLLVLRIFGNHLQVCAKVSMSFVRLPSALEGVFSTQGSVSSFDFNFSIVDCETSLTFFGQFFIILLLPFGFFVVIGALLVAKNKSKQRKSDEQLAWEEEEDTIARNTVMTREAFFGASASMEDGGETHNFQFQMNDLFPQQQQHPQQHHGGGRRRSMSHSLRKRRGNNHAHVPGAMDSWSQSCSRSAVSERSLAYFQPTAPMFNLHNHAALQRQQQHGDGSSSTGGRGSSQHSTSGTPTSNTTPRMKFMGASTPTSHLRAHQQRLCAALPPLPVPDAIAIAIRRGSSASFWSQADDNYTTPLAHAGAGGGGGGLTRKSSSGSFWSGEVSAAATPKNQSQQLSRVNSSKNITEQFRANLSVTRTQQEQHSEREVLPRKRGAVSILASPKFAEHSATNFGDDAAQPPLAAQGTAAFTLPAAPVLEAIEATTGDEQNLSANTNTYFSPNQTPALGSPNVSGHADVLAGITVSAHLGSDSPFATARSHTQVPRDHSNTARSFSISSEGDSSHDDDSEVSAIDVGDVEGIDDRMNCFSSPSPDGGAGGPPSLKHMGTMSPKCIATTAPTSPLGPSSAAAGMKKTSPNTPVDGSDQFQYGLPIVVEVAQQASSSSQQEAVIVVEKNRRLREKGKKGAINIAVPDLELSSMDASLVPLPQPRALSKGGSSGGPPQVSTGRYRDKNANSSNNSSGSNQNTPKNSSYRPVKLTRRTMSQFLKQMDGVSPRNGGGGGNSSDSASNVPAFTPKAASAVSPGAAAMYRSRRRKKSFCEWAHDGRTVISSDEGAGAGNTVRRNSDVVALPPHVSQFQLDFEKRHRVFREEPTFFTSCQVLIVVMSVVMFFFYLPIIETCSKMLLCEVLETGPDSYVDVLVADRRIDCTTEEYGQYRAAASFTMLWIGLGFPISFILLVRYYAARSPLPEFANDFAMKWRQTRRLFFFMSGGYNSDRWWWEAVVLTRKALIAIMSVAILDVHMRNYVSMWTIAFYLVVHLHMNPFEESILSRLETISLVTIFTTLNLAGLFGMYNEEDNTDLEYFLVATIMIINIACVACFAVVFVAATWRKLRQIHLNNPDLMPWFSVCFLSVDEDEERNTTEVIKRHRQELFSINERLETVFRDQSVREDFMFSAIDRLDGLADSSTTGIKKKKNASGDATPASLEHHFSPSVRKWYSANEQFMMQSRLLGDHGGSSHAIAQELQALLDNIFRAEDLVLKELLLRQQSFNHDVEQIAHDACSQSQFGQFFAAPIGVDMSGCGDEHSTNNRRRSVLEASATALQVRRQSFWASEFGFIDPGQEQPGFDATMTVP